MLYPVLQVAVFELHIGGEHQMNPFPLGASHREADLSFGNFAVFSNSDALPALPIGLRGHVK